jgi:proline iminopeptidase
VGDGPQAVIIPNGMHLIPDFERFASCRTVLFYDLRNRGLSDTITDESRIAHGIHHDVDDLESVRRDAGFDRSALIGHSYVGMTVILYAMKYPAHVDRVIQIGTIPPSQGKEYPAHLTGADATLRNVLAELAQLEKERASHDPTEFCRKVWSVLRVLYVADPADAHKITWGRCDVTNERAFMKYWTGTILPSIQRISLTEDDLARVTAPVLTIHGTRDRSAPYGGGRDWASILPNARLQTIEGAGHAPWIEDPAKVFGSIEAFLAGGWPESAEPM